MPCVKVGNAICCSFVNAVVHVRHKNRRYHWSFSEWFGPLFEKADGTVLEPQPEPELGNPSWDAFERWHEKYRQQHPRKEA